MSKSFINSILQYGGDLSDADKVVGLNIVAKQINKKMKIIEYKYGIQFKLEKLKETNSDCLPRKIGIQGIAQISGPLMGKIPYYTNAAIAIPSPTISTVNTAYPLTPFGPIVSVPSLAINPFGNTDRLEDRIEKTSERLKILKEIDEKLSKMEMCEIDKSDPLKKYFDYVDLKDPASFEEIENEIEEKINK
jgi:hypothetical protein